MNRLKIAMIWAFVAGAAAAWAFWCEVFVTDDSYFYLVIARNIVEHGSQTFNRVIPTNGFHPLWGYLLVVYDGLISIAFPDCLGRIESALPLVLAVVVAGVVQTRRLVKQIGAEPTVALAIPLVFLSYLGVLYSEAHLSWLCLTWFCAVLTNGSSSTSRHAVLVGVAASCCFLARLDTAFTVSFLLAWCMVRDRSWSRAWISLISFGILIVPYLLTNLLCFGGLMPVSGWIKSTFPHLELKGLYINGMATTLCGYSLAFGVIPIVCGWLAVAYLRPRLASSAAILYPLGLGALCQFGYIALFTRGHTDPYWYYVQPVFFSSVAIGLAIARQRSLLRVSELGSATVLVVTLVLLFAVRPRSIGKTRQFVPEALAFLQENDVHGMTILASDCPGKLAFHTDNGVFAVDMLTANRAFFGKMVASGNALMFIRAAAADAGRPLGYVFFLGNNRLTPSDDRTSLYYFSPREPGRQLIGELGKPDGLALRAMLNEDLVWTLDGSR